MPGNVKNKIIIKLVYGISVQNSRIVQTECKNIFAI